MTTSIVPAPPGQAPMTGNGWRPRPPANDLINREQANYQCIITNARGMHILEGFVDPLNHISQDGREIKKLTL